MTNHSTAALASQDQPSTAHFSSRAFLAGIGSKLKSLNLFAPIAERVKIAQKTVRDTPIEKLYDGLIGILCGAQGIVEVNKLVRSDRGLQRAFGRERCAEQSVIQQTLDASNAENVEQMYEAMTEIYRTHSRGYCHDYSQQIQILDVDMSGQPCGPKAAFATKGYFVGQRNRRGRQLGRVLATRYNEIVCERVYEGSVQLSSALQPLLSAAHQVLELDPNRLRRTLVRLDSGGGSVEDINWMLNQGYLVLAKDYSSQRARRLAESVSQWFEDPQQPGREYGLVTADASEYCQMVLRIAVRSRKNNGQWGVGVLVSNLMPNAIAELQSFELSQLTHPSQVWHAYVRCYDERGGGVETSFKQDNQALNIKKRNKKRFEAQQMLSQLNVLAHNILVWVQQWLLDSDAVARPRPIGFVRLLRDVFTTSGQLCFDTLGQLYQIRLNAADTLARPWVQALVSLLKSEHIDVYLAKI